MSYDSNAYIRQGDLRAGYTMVYHELYDLYHPYIGDKATMYYLYLLRYRNNETNNPKNGMAWRGRNGVVEKFQLSFSTLPILDAILEASGLVTIERRPSGRGKEKIYYYVHDPVDRQQFRENETTVIEGLRKVIETHKNVGNLLGKEKGAKLL